MHKNWHSTIVNMSDNVNYCMMRREGMAPLQVTLLVIIRPTDVRISLLQLLLLLLLLLLQTNMAVHHLHHLHYHHLHLLLLAQCFILNSRPGSSAILSSMDLFLYYRTDYTDSRTIYDFTLLNGCTGMCVRRSRLLAFECTLNHCTFISFHFISNLIDYVTYKVRCRISFSSYILAKTDPCRSRTVSLRQLSFLCLFCANRQTQTGSWTPLHTV